MVFPVESEPVDIVFDGLHIFGFLFSWVGIVHAEVAYAAELFSHAEVETYSLGVTYMEITVWFWRESGSDFASESAAGDVGRHFFADKVN